MIRLHTSLRLSLMLTLSAAACAGVEDMPVDGGVVAPDAASIDDVDAATPETMLDAGMTPEDSGAPVDAGEEADAGAMASWGNPCSEDEQCTSPTDFCVKQPGATDGYCSVRCTATAECTAVGVPSDWTCNTVFGMCDGGDFTWCGPYDEVTMSMGFVSECE